MSKTDQIAILRAVDILIGQLPKDTQARLLWEAHQMIARNITNTFVPERGMSSALYGTWKAVENSPSWMSANLPSQEPTNAA